MPKKKSARVPRATTEELNEVLTRIKARVKQEEEAWDIARRGHHGQHFEYVAVDEFVKALRAVMTDAELRERKLAPILEVVKLALITMKPLLPEPSPSSDYIYVVRATRELTGLYANDGVEVRAPNATEARRIVEDMDVRHKLAMKFEKCISKQPLKIYITNRRPAKDKEGEST